MHKIHSLSCWGVIASFTIGVPADVVAFQATPVEADTTAICAAPELEGWVEGPPAYVTAVCRGFELEQDGRLGAALEEYTRALEIPFHEGPNFLLLPHVANLSERLGNTSNGEALWAEAEVAFGLFFSVFICSPVRPDAIPIGAEAHSASAARRAAARMCGEAREWVYRRSSMDLLLADLPRLELYRRRVAERIRVP